MSESSQPLVARRRPAAPTDPTPAAEPATAPVGLIPLQPLAPTGLVPLVGLPAPAPVTTHSPVDAWRESTHSIAPGRTTPTERFDPTGAWSFSDLASACPTSAVDAGNRLDPYWDRLYGVGSGASWLTPDVANAQAEAGLGRLPAALAIPREEAVERLLASRGWKNRLALLGALFSWRTMTAEQAAAIVGDPALVSATALAASTLFASDLMDLGVYSNGLFNTDLTGRGALYRAGRSSVFDEHIKDRLTWPEWISVTGGQKWKAATPYDRHNALGTELALRLAEYAEVGTVLGERFSGVDLLLGREPRAGGGESPAADLTAVRPDGMRVAIEITANRGQHFNEKVRRWARILAENPLESSGLTVVFVIVEHADRLGATDTSVTRSRTYQAIAAACKEFPGSVRDRVAERIGVATWREWFPARGMVHDAFFTMRVDRPTGRGADLWEPADMLDPSSGPLGRPFSPRHPEEITAVLDNAALLGGTPHWLAESRSPEPVWPLLLDNAGLTHVPVPPPTKPSQFRGRPQSDGSVAATRAPRRLLALDR